MARVIDLTDDDSALRSTGSDGLLGSRYLDAPPAEQLRSEEEARYLLRNTDGVTVEGGDDLRPAEDYGAVAVLTDVRLLLLAGASGDDEVRVVPLHEVVEARVEQGGLLENTLVVETAGATYRFPCRGDVSAVANAVDDAAGAWGTIERRLDDTAAAIRAARDAADAGAYDRAFERLDDAAADVDAARERAAAVGPGATAAIEERATVLIDRLGATRRHVHVTRAGSAHADAQAAWRDRAYETAAARYETAVTGYREALAAPGETPADPALSARLDGAVRERAILAVAPVTDADTARRRAIAVDRPREAAPVWETALERYRDALELDWGSEPRRFRVDRGAVRERAAAVADAAVDAHRTAADRWRAAADRLVVADPDAPVADLYERARDHLDSALNLAGEVRPSRVNDLADERESVEACLDGDTPEQPPPPTGAPPAGVAGAADAPDAVATREAAGVTEGWAADSRLEPDDDLTTGLRNSRGPATPAADRVAETVAEADSVADERAALQELDAGSLAELVADTWTGTGWSATAFPGQDTLYDVFAARAAEDSGTVDRTVLRVVPGAEPPSSRAVDRCATAREILGGEAVLVTSAPVPPGIRRRAGELDVTVVDADDLVDRVREAGLPDRSSE